MADLAANNSRSTIHHRVKRFRQQVVEFLQQANDGVGAETVLADGTKYPCQIDEVTFNAVRLTLNWDVVGEDGDTTLLDVKSIV